MWDWQRSRDNNEFIHFRVLAVAQGNKWGISNRKRHSQKKLFYLLSLSVKVEAIPGYHYDLELLIFQKREKS